MNGFIKVAGLTVGSITTAAVMQFAHQQYYRPMILFAKDYFHYPLKIVEIGVFNGTNALRMFNALDVETMYLIDPYQKYQEYARESLIFPFLPINFDSVMDKLGDYAIHTVPLQMKAEEATKYVPFGIDMVYIDGNHQYEYVKKDIELYYGKVISGGMLGGHDIDGNALSQEIRDAVFEFADANNLNVYVDSPDWWIIKP